MPTEKQAVEQEWAETWSKIIKGLCEEDVKTGKTVLATLGWEKKVIYSTDKQVEQDAKAFEWEKLFAPFESENDSFNTAAPVFDLTLMGNTLTATPIDTPAEQPLMIELVGKEVGYGLIAGYGEQGVALILQPKEEANEDTKDHVGFVMSLLAEHMRQQFCPIQ